MWPPCAAPDVRSVTEPSADRCPHPAARLAGRVGVSLTRCPWPLDVCDIVSETFCCCL